MFITFTLGTLKVVFDHISKRLKVVQKYVATRRIFHSLLGVWKRGKTWSFVFHLLHKYSYKYSPFQEEKASQGQCIYSYTLLVDSFLQKNFLYNYRVKQHNSNSSHLSSSPSCTMSKRLEI